jgi:hypothetical protein
MRTLLTSIAAVSALLVATPAQAQWQGNNSDGVYRLACNEGVKANNSGRSVFDLATYTNAGIPIGYAMRLAERMAYCHTVGIPVW